MADEPERRLVGVIHAELEKQAEESERWNWPLVGPVATDGTCTVEGPVDLYLLARAIRRELNYQGLDAISELGEDTITISPCTCGQIHRNPEHRCLQHPDVRPKTRDEQAAFANAWDAKVAEGRK